jgi:MOSC domain-containing protein YiiM
LSDDAVCIGDRYQIGSAVFEVTQPRVTCYRVGIRMNEPRMPALLTSSGRPSARADTNSGRGLRGLAVI